MIDIFFSNNEFNFSVEKNQKALSSQLGMFLSCKTGELKYNEDYGLDYEILLNKDIDNKFKENLIRSKINKYFSNKIQRIHLVQVLKENRTLKIKVKYTSVYSEEVEEIEI